MYNYNLDTEPRQYVHTGGLVAAICGTAAAFDAVASFTGLGAERGRFPVNTAANRDYLVQTNSATDGSTFTINLRGTYHVKFTVNCVGAAGPVVVIGAIARNPAVAAQGGTVVNTSANIVDITQFSQIEAVTHSLSLSGYVGVDERMQSVALANTIQILLTDEAGATPPDADVVQASAFLVITRTGDLMGAFT